MFIKCDRRRYDMVKINRILPVLPALKSAILDTIKWELWVFYLCYDITWVVESSHGNSNFFCESSIPKSYFNIWGSVDIQKTRYKRRISETCMSSNTIFKGGSKISSNNNTCFSLVYNYPPEMCHNLKKKSLCKICNPYLIYFFFNLLSVHINFCVT